MFKSFRWRIAIWFVGLSSLVYLIMSLMWGFLFYKNLSHALDEELAMVASYMQNAIDFDGERLAFRDWFKVVNTASSRSAMSVQLFDADGKLVEHHGPPGGSRLLQSRSEVSFQGYSRRVRQDRLFHQGTLIGYLQLQLPTKRRYVLVKEYLLTRAVMALFVLSGLGLCSYIVSGIASQPIEGLVETLRHFVAEAGHELNTPASIIQARAESLSRKLQRQGLYEEDVKIIASSAERMGKIVKGLMLLAELDSHYQPVSRTSVDVLEVVNSIVQEFSSTFADKNITLETGLLKPVTIFADREALACILRNLIENAIRYTESNGTVTISCEVISGDACIVVEDTGIGISNQCLPFIFDRFYRVDKSRSRASGGSGLGLAIVKAMIDNLSGKIEVSSQVGKGTKFRILLPMHKKSALSIGA